jgi:NAD-dependent deacetylase
VVLTGAGISTESGIPDYRGAGRNWARYDPEDLTYARFVASESARRNYWRMAREFFTLTQAVQPNAAHRALAELERKDVLQSVLTQNVDGLHQRAGHRADRVLEVHGTAARIRCLDCDMRIPAGQLYLTLGDGEVPYCVRCGGILKPDVVLFGEPIEPAVAAVAVAQVARCDLLLVVGSSLVVQPFASLPARAKDRGARLAIVNLSSTPHDADMDVIVRGAAGEVLPQMVANLDANPASV